MPLELEEIFCEALQSSPSTGARLIIIDIPSKLLTGKKEEEKNDNDPYGFKAADKTIGGGGGGSSQDAILMDNPSQS